MKCWVVMMRRGEEEGEWFYAGVFKDRYSAESYALTFLADSGIDGYTSFDEYDQLDWEEQPYIFDIFEEEIISYEPLP